MLVNKSKAAELVGVSRRTFYNHITKKNISVTKDDDGNEKIDISELKRVYGPEKILKNMQKLEEGGNTENVSKSVKPAQINTEKTVQYNAMLLEEKLKGAQALIEQLKSEREQLVDDKKRMQEQLDKALEIGAPIGKLLTDQREHNESRGRVERQVIEEQVKKENAEKRIRGLQKRLKDLRDENIELKGRPFLKRLFG
jgi:hypothetical protein